MRFLLAVFLAVTASGCVAGLNYGPTGPRYFGEPTPIFKRVDVASDTLRVVSFNIAFAKRVDRAIAVLTRDSTLRIADVVLLQEMDEPGARKVADALGMWYAYYPATFHLLTNRDFGNAVLSRWPIVEDSKILLPHISRFRKTQRAATAATLRVGDKLVRVYSAHLGTPADVGPGARRNQLRTILADAARYERVIIGGDMNNFSVGRVARDSGYHWPTEKGARTIRLWKWDHIFLKGLALPDSAPAGGARDAGGASDHKPIWAVGILR